MDPTRPTTDQNGITESASSEATTIATSRYQIMKQKQQKIQSLQL